MLVIYASRMKPWSFELRGSIDEQTVTSELLRNNPLGDPHERPLLVYLPPGYTREPKRRYPSIYVLQGLTGQLDMWRNRAAFRKNPLELCDELFASDGVRPCIVVFVDCWTRLGGSQFLDSPGTGATTAISATKSSHSWTRVTERSLRASTAA